MSVVKIRKYQKLIGLKIYLIDKFVYVDYQKTPTPHEILINIKQLPLTKNTCSLSFAEVKFQCRSSIFVWSSSKKLLFRKTFLLACLMENLRKRLHFWHPIPVPREGCMFDDVTLMIFRRNQTAFYTNCLKNFAVVFSLRYDLLIF